MECSRSFPSCLSLVSGSKLTIKDNFYIYYGTRVSVRGALALGSGYINYGISFCYEKIVIGNDVAIGPHICIRDTDSHQIISQGNQIVNQVSSPVHLEIMCGLESAALFLNAYELGIEQLLHWEGLLPMMYQTISLLQECLQK